MNRRIYDPAEFGDPGHITRRKHAVEDSIHGKNASLIASASNDAEPLLPEPPLSAPSGGQGSHPPGPAGSEHETVKDSIARKNADLVRDMRGR